MSGINLNKNGVEMQSAWKNVCNPDKPEDWALFGYEGTSNVLTLIGSGEDGIDELKEDLNCNKIMYAFVKLNIADGLSKNVLINWQGESAPGTRKGTCATHIRDVAAYFTGASLTINARNEDEIDEDEIKEKISKTASTTAFIKSTSTNQDVPTGPVGSNHQRIIPSRELPNLSQRESFWEAEENKEKERIKAEKKRLEEERSALDAERRRREETDSKKREESVLERERKISQIREAERKTSQIKEQEERRNWETQLKADAEEALERSQRGEHMKAERTKEAAELIKGRSSEARKVFERNTSRGQMNFATGPRKPPIELPKKDESETPPPTVAAAAAPAAAPEPKVPTPSPPKASKEPASSSSPPPPQVDNDVVPPPDSFNMPDVAPVTSPPDLIADVSVTPDVTTSSNNGTKSPTPPQKAANNGGDDYGIVAVALYDYQAADDTEISFDPNQVITNIDKIDPGWWQGVGPDGNFGLFPANYVEIVDSSQITTQQS